MTGPEFEKAIVALACYQIGHKELYRGMSAVLMMFQNSVEAGQNQSLYELAAQHLGCDLDGSYPDSRDPEFHKLLMAVEAAYQGSLVDKTGGARFYLDANYNHPTREASYTVGQLHFYR